MRSDAQFAHVRPQRACHYRVYHRKTVTAVLRMAGVAVGLGWVAWLGVAEVGAMPPHGYVR